MLQACEMLTLLKHKVGEKVEQALVELLGALGRTPDLSIELLVDDPARQQRRNILGTDSPPASSLGKLLTSAVLLDDEEGHGADDGDGAKVAEQHAVRGDLLVILEADASRDANSNGVGDDDNGRSGDVDQVVELGSLVRVELGVLLGSSCVLVAILKMRSAERNVRLLSALDFLLRLDNLGQVVDEAGERGSVKGRDDVGGEGSEGLESLGGLPLVGAGDAAHGKLADVQDDLAGWEELDIVRWHDEDDDIPIMIQGRQLP